MSAFEEQKALDLLDRAAVRAENILKIAADRAELTIALATERSKDQIEFAAKAAAHEVLAGVFGIDTADKVAMERVRDNMTFLNNLKRSSDQVSSAGRKAMATVLVTALAGVLWLGFKETVISWLHLGK
jgi:hypothetical protein